MAQTYDPTKELEHQLIPMRQNVVPGKVTVKYDDLIIANEGYSISLERIECISIDRKGKVEKKQSIQYYALSSNTVVLEDLTIYELQIALNKQVCLHYYRQFDIVQLIEMNIDPTQPELTAILVSVVLEKKHERSPNDSDETILKQLYSECVQTGRFHLAREFQQLLTQFDDNAPMLQNGLTNTI